MNGSKNKIKAGSLSTALVSGFTLIEVLVAVVIIGVGCLAAVRMQATSMQAGSQAEQLTLATFLATSEYERLRSMENTDIRQQESPLTLTECISRDGVSQEEEEGICEFSADFPFQRTTTIYQNVPTNNSNWLKIKVTWAGLGHSNLVVEGATTDFSY